MRPEGWEFRLADAVRAAEGREWKWGSHDCGHFARDCASAVLNGPTPWDEVFTNYSTETGAARLLTRQGGLVSILDRVPQKPVLSAQRGDLAVIRGNGYDPDPDGELAVGVIDGKHIVLAALGGLARWPVSLCEHAWPVG